MKTSRALALLTAFLLIVLLLTGAAAYFTHGFTDASIFVNNGNTDTDKQPFSISAGNAKLSDGDTLDLTDEVHLTTSASDYKVTVIANPETSFNFLLDGKPAAVGLYEYEYTIGFEIEQRAQNLSIKAPNYLIDVLSAVYPGKEITELPTVDADKSYFIALITPTDGAAPIKLYLKGAVKYAIHTGITVDPPEIIF